MKYNKPYLHEWISQNLCACTIQTSPVISIGNGMIGSDIWHKYHKCYFKIVIQNFTSR